MVRRGAAVLIGALAAAGATDIAFHGHLTLFEPWEVAAIAGFAAGFAVSLVRAAKLRANSMRYKGLVDSQGDAVLRREPDGRVTYANAGFCALFGVSAADAIGKPFVPELHPETPPPLFGRLAGRETGRERVSYDHHVKTVAGYRWIAWEDYPIRDAQGRLIEIQSTGRDVTDRKNLEAALMEARDKAEEANRAKSQFLATMSHEIRTPMNGVLGMARLLLETELAPDQKSYADAIKQSGLSLLALIEDILDFYKIEAGALVLEPSEVTLRPLLEGIVELLATRAHSKGVEIATAIAADVPETITTDAVRLRQVLTNLVGNAIKFTEEGGVLVSAHIDCGEQGAAIRFAVRDTGIGVPLEKQAAIFEDFVQADSSNERRSQGTGLGLSISRRLVAAMGGEIGMKSSDGGGSEFWIAFPMKLHGSSQRSPALSGTAIALTCQSRILCEGLRLQLEAAGARLTAAASLHDLRGHRPSDILLIDVPASDDATLAELTTLQTPAVALIPPNRRDLLSELSAKGYRGYLMKPVRQQSMETRLSAIISGASETERPAAQPQSKWRSRESLAILLAEDNAINALLARELLRRRGHRVECATTGEAAVLACAQKRYDLVIMDLHMPGLDGVEAARRIRVDEAEANAKPVPIIALTADALETGRKACLEAGMDGFLTKPLDPAELDTVLANLMPPAIVAAE